MDQVWSMSSLDWNWPLLLRAWSQEGIRGRCSLSPTCPERRGGHGNRAPGASPSGHLFITRFTADFDIYPLLGEEAKFMIPESWKAAERPSDLKGVSGNEGSWKRISFHIFGTDSWQSVKVLAFFFCLCSPVHHRNREILSLCQWTFTKSVSLSRVKTE